MHHSELVQHAYKWGGEIVQLEKSFQPFYLYFLLSLTSNMLWLYVCIISNSNNTLWAVYNLNILPATIWVFILLSPEGWKAKSTLNPIRNKLRAVCKGKLQYCILITEPPGFLIGMATHILSPHRCVHVSVCALILNFCVFMYICAVGSTEQAT